MKETLPLGRKLNLIVFRIFFFNRTGWFVNNTAKLDAFLVFSTPIVETVKMLNKYK